MEPPVCVQNLVLGLLIMAVIWLLALIPYQWGHNNGYREGQIDALNGAIYYKLERQSDSEFRWIECQGICRYGKEGEE